MSCKVPINILETTGSKATDGRSRNSKMTSKETTYIAIKNINIKNLRIQYKNKFSL